VTVERQPRAIVDINGLPYRLATDPQSGQLGWHPRLVATQEGDPTVPRRYRWNDWSRGIGDSRGVFRGAVESCSNAYLGMIGRILPGPNVGTIATGHDSAVTDIVEVTAPAARIISFGGRYTKEIDPSNQTVAATGDLGVGASAVGAQLFIDQVAIALGDATQFFRRSAAGAYSASTVTSDASGTYRYARAFGLSPEGDLVRGRASYWSKCSAADFYATNGNWSAEYSIGDASANINAVGGFQRWDYVYKDEGLYTFDQTTSKESNELPDLVAFRSSVNKRWFAWYNRLFLCSLAGLYRYLQNGGARTVGIEEAELNEGILTNAYPTAGTAFGKWAYVAYYDPAGNTTYLCQMRNARDGDANFGSPFTITNVVDSFTGLCQKVIISSAPGSPTVYFGRGVDVGYFTLTRDGRPASYRSSGSTVVTFSPTDLGAPMTVKYARGLEVIGRNFSAARSAQFAAAWDGGSFNSVGAAITSLTNTFASRFWTLASNDHGRVLQLKATLGLDSTSTPPEIRDLVLNYEERPAMVPGGLLLLELRDDAAEGRAYAYERKAALEALCGSTPVSFTDPDGDTYTAAFSQYQGDVEYQRKGGRPQNVISLMVRRMDYS
jgi:hypothetical protein